jgi:hypothetical protein
MADEVQRAFTEAEGFGVDHGGGDPRWHLKTAPPALDVWAY